MLFALLGICAFSACWDAPCENGMCVDESATRLLDRVCAEPLPDGPACETEGQAVQTTGITADTIGFRLGDGGGALTIHLDAMDAVTRGAGTFSIEILGAARHQGETAQLTSYFTWGSCDGDCPPDPRPVAIDMTSDHRWITVVADQATSPTSPAYDGTLTLRGAGIDIVDVRSTSVYPSSCSVVGPVGAR